MVAMVKELDLVGFLDEAAVRDQVAGAFASLYVPFPYAVARLANFSPALGSCARANALFSASSCDESLAFRPVKERLTRCRPSLSAGILRPDRIERSPGERLGTKGTGEGVGAELAWLFHPLRF